MASTESRRNGKDPEKESPWVLLQQLNPPKYDVSGPQFTDNVTMETTDGISIEPEKVLEVKSDGPVEKRLLYGIEERPPVHLAMLFGLQNLLLSISGCMSVPIIVTGLVCAGNLPLVKAQIIGTFLVMCGVSTILQCVVGVRLPILQGGSSTFIPPIMAMMTLDQWACPESLSTENGTTTIEQGDMLNSTFLQDDENEIWQRPMREIQGAVMLASLTQCCIGGFGLIGPLLRIIGPLTVAPCVALIGLALTKICIPLCAKQWGIAILCYRCICSATHHSMPATGLAYPSSYSLDSRE